jgi:hypothetical protein
VLQETHSLTRRYRTVACRVACPAAPWSGQKKKTPTYTPATIFHECSVWTRRKRQPIYVRSLATGVGDDDAVLQSKGAKALPRSPHVDP